MAILTAIITRELTGGQWQTALFFAAIIIIFALLGDLLASYFKRQYKVKDFGNSLPGMADSLTGSTVYYQEVPPCFV